VIFSISYVFRSSRNFFFYFPINLNQNVLLLCCQVLTAISSIFEKSNFFILKLLLHLTLHFPLFSQSVCHFLLYLSETFSHLLSDTVAFLSRLLSFGFFLYYLIFQKLELHVYVDATLTLSTFRSWEAQSLSIAKFLYKLSCILLKFAQTNHLEFNLCELNIHFLGAFSDGVYLGFYSIASSNTIFMDLLQFLVHVLSLSLLSSLKSLKLSVHTTWDFCL
jgi:hypothetical protein